MMRIVRLLTTATILITFGVALISAQDRGAPAAQRGAGGPGGQRGPAMALTTTAWPDGGQIPVKYTQAAEQVSPELKWTNTPAGTQSFVLHMLDPDVAQNRGTETQVHWLVWNIPPTATGLPEGVPVAAKLQDGSEQISATAPATGPHHHYTFEIYALDTKLDVQRSTNAQPGAAAVETRTNVMKAMQGHVLGKAVYVGLFRRPQ
jgi:Raf kinase inhibitor-like YbhB/YbcL family protein